MVPIFSHRACGSAPRRARAAWALAAVAASLCGCAAQGQATRGEKPPPAARASAPTPSRPLPAGDGKAILERACTGCHDLEGLWAYRGYYNEARWRAMIMTMVDHGAQLDEAEIATLTGYLVEHFGPGTRP